MSAQIDRIYKLAFRKNFTNYEGNFPPSRQLELGDYGVIKNGYFSRLDNIRSLLDKDEKLEIQKDTSPSHETFKSSKNVNFSSIAKGDILIGGAAATKASLEIGFTEEEAVFFSSAEVSYNEIKKIDVIGNRLLELYNKGKWKKEFHLVTRLIEGKNSVIIISGSSTCKVNLEAKSDIPKIDLGNANIALDFKSVQQTAYEVIVDDVCQLGMGLSRIYDTLFIKPKFRSAVSNIELFASLDHKASENIVFGDVSPQSLDSELA